MWLHREGARPHGRTNFIPHQGAIGKAQRGIGLEVESEMMVEVRRIIHPDTQDAAVLGLPGLSAPECRGAREGQGRQCHASSKAGFQEIATFYPVSLLGMCLPYFHGWPSL